MANDEAASTSAITWRQTSHWSDMYRPMVLLCIGMAVVACANLLESVLMAHLFEPLRNPDVDTEIDYDALFSKVRLYTQVFSVVFIAASALMLAGMLRLSSAPTTTRVRTIGLVACAAIGVGILWHAATGLGATGDHFKLNEFLWSKNVRYALTIASTASSACLLLVFIRVAHALQAPPSRELVPLAWVWIAWDAGFVLYSLIFEPRLEMANDAPWTFLALTSGIQFLGRMLLLFIAYRTLTAFNRHADGASGEASAREHSFDGASPEWLDVASGLDLYTSALGWRVSVTISAYVLLLLSINSQSTSMIKLIVVLLPLVAIITTFIMVLGVARYAKQPVNSPAAGAAWFAFALMSIGLILDGYGLILTLELFSLMNAEWPSASEIRSVTESMQSMSMWAMGLGFGSLLALLISFGQVTSLFERTDLRDRVVGVSLFICFTSVTVLGFRSYIADAPPIDAGSLITYALLILGLALAALLTYINLVKRIARSIRRDGDSELPPAKVIHTPES